MTEDQVEISVIPAEVGMGKSEGFSLLYEPIENHVLCLFFIYKSEPIKQHEVSYNGSI